MNRLPTLTEIAKGTAVFQWYSDGTLRYDLWWKDEEQDMVLPFDIPTSDAGQGHFTPTMKGLNVLRWARKHVDMLKESRENQAL